MRESSGEWMTSFWNKAAAEAADHKSRGDVIAAEFGGQASERRSIRRDPPPLTAALSPTDDRLRLRIAEELEYARRMLTVMGDELAGNPAVIARHATALQSFDIVGQMLGHLAAVIRSSDPEEAVERVGMTELKARLSRRSLD